MKNAAFNKIISIFLTLIFIIGLFPPAVFAQQSPASGFGDIRGFNKSVFDSHFSRADREINPERWLSQARLGLTQAMNAWELTAGNLFDNPHLFAEAKDHLEMWGNEELERRFSQWLLGRFFGSSAENAMMNFFHAFGEAQKYFSWHLDEAGNIIFDDKTGDPLVIRPSEEGREFSHDLLMWRDEAEVIVRNTNASLDNVMLLLYPELLAYIPVELRETMSNVIFETVTVKTSAIKREFENIAAREESIFTSRRTRDIWSLRSKSENEAARIFTERLIADTEEACRAGIEELNSRIEQAAAGTGDLAVMGEEWLRLYKEQFDRGLKAWEEAEERFFVRRIEWEQESFRLFSEGEEIWLSAFSQFEEQRRLWELQAKELFQSGEALFLGISEEFEKNINEARREFELNMAMRTGEGTVRVKALIEMYLISSSAAITAMENVKFWEEQKNETERQKAHNLYLSYMNNALDARDRILADYAGLLGTGALKDILSPNASTEDFTLDEYQIALVRAKALVLYWERKTAIAEAVTAYAGELSAGRMTEAEGLRAWEQARAAYNESLAVYEIELGKLNEIGEDIFNQQEILRDLAQKLQREEDKLKRLNNDYLTLVSSSAINLENYYFNALNAKYEQLVREYKKFQITERNSVYFSALEYGLKWGIAEYREMAVESAEEEEIWQNTLNSLALLFGDYGLEPAINFFPDIQDLCNAIFGIPGDFLQNIVQFLMEFSNCIVMLPQWLEYEINGWKEALSHYAAAFAFNKGLRPEKNTKMTAMEQELLADEYFKLYEYAVSLIDIDDDEIESLNIKFGEISVKLLTIYYTSLIAEAWEKINALSAGNEKHWRQFLTDQYIANIDPALISVFSMKEGLLADALYTAEYYSNRVNDSFTMYSQREKIGISENAEYYFMLYSGAVSDIDADYNSLKLLYDEITGAAREVEFSRLPVVEMRALISSMEEEIKVQENIYNRQRNEYLQEVEEFIYIGTAYDRQYSVLKRAHGNSDTTRFEYEKQDAIQRWAGTAYLDIDNIGLENNKTKLLRAQTVLDVLSALYNDENSRPYNNPEYDAIFTAYEQGFIRKFKALEAAETVALAYAREKENNERLYSSYQNSLRQFGNIDDSIKNLVTLKDGRLAFITDGSGASDLDDFFNAKYIPSGELFETSEFAESVRSLGERMAGYLTSDAKFRQWGMAVNYLILSLSSSDKNNFSFLMDRLSGLGALASGGSLHGLTIVTDVKLFWDVTNGLYSMINDRPLISNPEIFFRNEWNKLSAAEKADLEYYFILSLSGNSNSYLAGFSQVYTLAAYQLARDYVDKRYQDTKYWDQWWTFGRFRGPVKTNRFALNRVDSVLNTTKAIVQNWISGLSNNILSINTLYSSYLDSSKKLEALEGKKTDGQNIKWADINLALSHTPMKDEDIDTLGFYWESMREKSSGREYQNISDALMALLYWSTDEENKSKDALEIRWREEEYKRENIESNFLKAADSYFAGTIGIEALKTAAEDAYGKNSAAWKNHYSNMHASLLSNISMYMDSQFNFHYEFSVIGNELASLTARTLESRYMAELSAREIEWSLMLKDIMDKYFEWQDSAALILENGRMDWLNGLDKMEASYRNWHINFQNEYERVDSEWTLAYLAGLEDKERWLKQAAGAAEEASSEAFLSLIGSEAERMSRFMDIREPFGIRGAVPQAQTLMMELVQSSGIVNMSGALGSINSIAGTVSVAVKRGMGGISIWNASAVKTAAADLARKTNAEIADSEAKKIAHNARLTAGEAVRGLAANVETANQNLRENIDDTFIFGGLWTKSGNNYVKEVVKGSTLFTPVISQTVTITGYANYIMAPVNLQTNLDENFLESLNSIAVWHLVENVYAEIQAIAEEIFGKPGEKSITINKNGKTREQSPGLFGGHIGYNPADKLSDYTGKNRNEMFYDEGAGELGRLLTLYTYWAVIDAHGYAELALPLYDKRIWNDEGSWFKAPSLRTVGTIACSIIAGVVSGGAGFMAGAGLLATAATTALISTASEIIFGTLDVIGGFKTFDEAIFNIGKSFVTNTITSMAGGLFNGIGEGTSLLNQGLTKTITGNVSGEFGKIATKTLMTGVQTLTTGLVTNAIGGITYSREHGLGYNTDAFKSGMINSLKSSLTSMTTTFTTSSLTAINSGLNLSKLTGFNMLNQSDLQKLNGLIGSLAGQGINYALGNDFSLNVLNLSLFSNQKHQSGLLELNFGRQGISMNIGTGGANISLDNLLASLRGATVWSVNSQISSYGRKNDFDALISLRAQYGYGDNGQVEQLREILKGETLLNTGAEGDFEAHTTRNDDGKKVINLAFYEKNMSIEDQFRLAAILGYETYRDGYFADSASNAIEHRDATIAMVGMANRINNEHGWFYNANDDFALDRIMLDYARELNDMSIFEDYLKIFYNNEEDYRWLTVSTGGNFQNSRVNGSSLYANIPLLNSLTEERITALNEERLQRAYNEYLSAFSEESLESAKSRENFAKDEDLLKTYNYNPMVYTSLASYGCVFFSTKYGFEAISGQRVETFELHDFIRKNGYYTGLNSNLLSNELMAKIMTEYSGGEFTVSLMDVFFPGLSDADLRNFNRSSYNVFNRLPTTEELRNYESSLNEFLGHLRVQNPNNRDAIIHSVMVSDIRIFQSYSNLQPVNTSTVIVDVANPLQPSTHFNSRTRYILQDIVRMDVFRVVRHHR